MVGLVIISHSKKVAEGAIEIAKQMAPEVKMVAAGGTKDGIIGTDIDIILDGINEIWSEDGVLVLFDLGSALMNAEMALEMLDEDKQKNVELVDAALIEGTISAAVSSSIGKSREVIKKELEELKLNKIN